MSLELILKKRSRLFALFSWVLIALAFIAALRSFRMIYEPVDFAAFTCGAKALQLQQDPYLAHSLHACEMAEMKELGFPIPHFLTIPSPFPAYALKFFGLLTVFSTVNSFAAWEVLILACFAFMIVILHNLTNLPVPMMIGAMFLQCFAVALPLGQFVPFVGLAMCIAVWSLEHEKYILTSLAAIFTLLEPSLGLPFCLGLFLVAKNVRWSLICFGIALGIIWLVSMPLATNIEYLTQVLHAHALSEAFNDDQYSTIHLFVLFGMQPDLALKWGAGVYVLALIVGGIGAVWLARVRGDRALSIFFPVVLCLIASPFMHVQELLPAVIAGLLLYSRSNNLLIAICCVFLALPVVLARNPLESLEILLLSGVFIASMLARSSPLATYGLLPIIQVLLSMREWLGRKSLWDMHYHQRALALQAYLPGSSSHPVLADIIWMNFIVNTHAGVGAWYLVFYVPVCAAMVGMIVGMWRFPNQVA